MTIIYFLIILGIIIFIHELGHFIFAKKAGVYVYEFALGMGPKIISKKSKKSETTYSLRLIPLGGFCAMAGEDEEDPNVPKDKHLNNKKWFQRFMVLFAGPMMNFVLAFFLLFLFGLIYGSYDTKPIVGIVEKDSPAYISGLKIGDEILAVNNKKVGSWDSTITELQFVKEGKVKFKIERDNKKMDVIIRPEKQTDKDGNVSYHYGIGQDTKKINHGVMPSIKFAANKIVSLTDSMVKVIKGLFTGKVGISSMSGPVGIYEIVGSQAKAGISNLIYLTAYLSINVGFMNLIPFPAFDGGRILFLIIEAIRRKRITPKVEATVNNVGFMLLIGLMLFITVNDVIRIIK